MMVNWYDQTHFKRQPWKNGLGETIELFCLPDPLHPQNFLFRLSMAKIEVSGPFSSFPGIDRHLVLIKGNKLTLLRENGDFTELRNMDTVSFRGEEKIESQVSENCVDFNVMTKRGWKKTIVQIINLAKKGTLRLGPETYLYQLSGELKMNEETKQKNTLWEIKGDIEIESKTDSTSILISII